MFHIQVKAKCVWVNVKGSTYFLDEDFFQYISMLVQDLIQGLILAHYELEFNILGLIIALKKSSYLRQNMLNRILSIELLLT